MKFSNLQRIATLTLLASAANSAFAAPAPVSDVNASSSSYSNASPETRLDRLERLVNSRSQVQIQLQQQLDSMSSDIENLRGQLERNSHQLQQMLDRQRELFVEMDKLRSNMQPSSNADAANGSDAKSDDDGTYTANVNEQQAYQNAVDMILKKRDYAGAIAAFVKFQKDYPKSAFAPNAYYWLGQLYFAKRQDKDAISSFQSVLKYDNSNKRADALVKLGDIERRNGNKANANKYYKQVISQYPNTASADAAQKNINSAK